MATIDMKKNGPYINKISWAFKLRKRPNTSLKLLYLEEECFPVQSENCNIVRLPRSFIWEPESETLGSPFWAV